MVLFAALVQYKVVLWKPSLSSNPEKITENPGKHACLRPENILRMPTTMQTVRLELEPKRWISCRFHTPARA